MLVRRSSKIYAALGVLLIALAALLRFVLVPTLSKLPDNLDVNPVYAGTGTMLNAQALQAGDLPNVISSGVPVTVNRHIYVSESDSNTAVAHDDVTLEAAGTAVPSNHTYLIDRKTMDAPDGQSREGVESHSGMTIGLPLHPDSTANYQYYDSATATTAPMTYVGPGTVAGRDVLNYTVEAQGTLRDPAIAGTLPPALPKALVGSLAPLLPPDVQQRLGGALGQLADPVPFTYTAVTSIDLAADRTLGTPIDAKLHQQIIANVEVDGQTVPVMPVMSIDTALTEQSIQDAAAAAKSTSTQLNLISVVVPLVLLVLGINALAFGVFRRGPKPATPAPARLEQTSVR